MVMTMIGRTRIPSGRPAGDRALPQAEEGHEHRQAQQAVDDRRHAGEVADVRADEPGRPGVVRVLLQVDRGPDAERQRDETMNDHQDQRADDARRDPGRRAGSAREWLVSRLARTGRSPDGLDEDVVQKDEHAEADDERQQQEDLQGDAPVGLAASRRRLEAPRGKWWRRRSSVRLPTVGRTPRTRLRNRVRTNRVRPTTKRRCTATDPTGFSPPAVCAMKPGHRLHALEGVDARGSSGRRPPARRSSSRRPRGTTPRTTAAAMPDRAAGKTTRSVVCIRFAPMAERTLPQRLRHRRQGVLGERGHRRDDHHAEDQARRECVGEVRPPCSRCPGGASGSRT